ncbi:NAD(P)H-quinone oxidoreductase subunit L [Romeria aff. gracilis LEGE 07310]|uniref:NAD(P)H-quinone oxidoreductase subunit L n=1 Tax=Vasconcelosia minhoensis LEGE 07310 TaxID=915328 RepID=A0A8J7AVF1_9CYAN|nr:NAD(P)H-quinone oxidoreductase subunit L [Romeria gracilis]MBE9077673.1 NAD(P)H-quinone oxidoreductase subunit L [Romeria aff. gracilis LEGE 07310]
MLIAALLYAALGGLYLLVIPAALMYYLKLRWNTVSSVERLILYALMFVFFPGMLLLSPLLNFRPQRREV